MQYEKPIKKTFSSPVILIGGGTIYHKDILTQRANQGWPIIAADGGLNALQPLGLTAELVIGDCDSLEPSKAAITKIHYPEQTTTDFEKCLYTLEAPLVMAFGFTGKRFDHTLAMLHGLTCYGQKHNIIMVDEMDCFHPFSTALTLKLKENVRVSLYPLSTITFATSTGLAYPLDGLTLSQGDMIGCSNRSIADTISIIPKQTGGLSLLILPIEWLDQLQETLT